MSSRRRSQATQQYGHCWGCWNVAGEQRQQVLEAEAAAVGLRADPGAATEQTPGGELDEARSSPAIVSHVVMLLTIFLFSELMRGGRRRPRKVCFLDIIVSGNGSAAAATVTGTFFLQRELLTVILYWASSRQWCASTCEGRL